MTRNTQTHAAESAWHVPQARQATSPNHSSAFPALAGFPKSFPCLRPKPRSAPRDNSCTGTHLWRALCWVGPGGAVTTARWSPSPGRGHAHHTGGAPHPSQHWGHQVTPALVFKREGRVDGGRWKHGDGVRRTQKRDLKGTRCVSSRRKPPSPCESGVLLGAGRGRGRVTWP